MRGWLAGTLLGLALAGCGGEPDEPIGREGQEVDVWESSCAEAYHRERDACAKLEDECLERARRRLLECLEDAGS